MPKHVVLTHEIRGILQACEITERTVKIPLQLERPQYDALNKVLVAAGGKWSRHEKAHLFARDPREALGLAVETGIITDPKILLGQFWTPPELAERMAALAILTPQDTVLEPSCGEGALAKAALERVPAHKIICLDIDQRCVDVCQQAGFLASRVDFLALQPEKFSLRFEAILMNPPFAGNAALFHVLHALQFLRPGGRLVAILPAGVQMGSTKLHLAFQTRLRLHASRVDALPEGIFQSVGTGVNTVMVTLHL